MTIPNQYISLFDKFPFLALVTCGNQEYVGIIQNQDNNVVSMYVYELINTTEEKKLFLQYGAEWWWETNRQIPINIVIGPRFKHFRCCLKTFTTKDFELLHGPTVCLRNIMQKRVKRKNVQLIRRPK